MSPKQKTIDINTIKNILESVGFTLDRYDNYIISYDNHLYRIKLKDDKIRIEIKRPKTTFWDKIFYQPIEYFNEKSFIDWLTDLEE